jgi:hypothetical protein
MAKTLEQTVARYQAGAAGAQQAFTEGVQNTNVDVVGRAIASQASLLAGFQEAVTSGRWAQALQRVGTAGWKDRTTAKAANYGVGVQAGLDRYQQSMGTWLPRINSAAAAARAMPGATLQQRLARANYFATTLYNAKRGM